MKFQKTPLILLFTALVLGGFVYFHAKKEPQQTETKSESNPIFAFQEKDVQAFTIQTAKQRLSFEKLPTPVPVGQEGSSDTSSWQMIAPEKTAANEGTVAFLLNLMVTSRSDRVIPTPASRKSEFGLEQPFATVEVKGNQQTHRLLLGKPNFNRSFLYALVNPPENANQDLSVLLVPIDFNNAINRPLSEWKQAKEKPGASPAPTATASPTPTISPTSPSN